MEKNKLSSEKSKSGKAVSGSPKPPEAPVEVPAQALDDVVLGRIVEEFVLREGTDYGLSEVTHETKVTQVLRQIEKGEVKIFFDPESQSVTLVNHRKGI